MESTRAINHGCSSGWHFDEQNGGKHEVDALTLLSAKVYVMN